MARDGEASRGQASGSRGDGARAAASGLTSPQAPQQSTPRGAKSSPRVARVLAPLEDYSFAKVPVAAAGHKSSPRPPGKAAGQLPPMQHAGNADSALSGLANQGEGRASTQGALSIEEVAALHKQLLSTMDVMSVDSVTQRITNIALTLLQVQRVRVYLAETSKDGEVSLINKGIERTGQKFPVLGITGHVYTTGQVAIVNALRGDDRFATMVDSCGIDSDKTRNLMSVPIVNSLNSREVGVITVVNRKNGQHFSATDLGLLKIIAAQAATSIEVVQRFDAIVAVQRKYRALFDAFLTLSEISSTADLVHQAGVVAKDLTGAEKASCFVLSNDQTDLCTWATVHAEHTGVLKKSRVPLRGVLHSVIQESKSDAPRSLQSSGPESEIMMVVGSDKKEAPPYRFHMGTLISPVIDSNRKAVGLLQVRQKKGGGNFDATDGLLLSACSMLVATLLSNAQVNEDLGSAYDDMLNSQRRDLPSLCANVTQRMMWASDSQHCSIFVCDRSGQFLWHPPAVGASRAASLVRVPISMYPLGFVARHNACVTNESPMPAGAEAIRKQLSAAVGIRDIREWCVVPFHDAASNVRGVALLANRNSVPRSFGKHHTAALSALAKTCGPYLCLGIDFYEHDQDALALDGLENKLDVTLSGVEGLLAIEDDSVLMRRLGETVQDFLRCELCLVFLAKTTDGTTALHSEQTGSIPPITIPYGTGIVGHVAATAQPYRGMRRPGDTRFNIEIDRAWREGEATQSVLCVPVLSSSTTVMFQNGREVSGLSPTGTGPVPRDAVMGVVILMNKLDSDCFSEADERHLQGFTRVSAVAIENILVTQRHRERNSVLQRLVRRHNILSSIDRMVPSARHLTKLAAGVAKVAAECVDSSSSIFYLVDGAVSKLFGFSAAGTAGGNKDPAAGAAGEDGDDQADATTGEMIRDMVGLAGEVAKGQGEINIARNAHLDPRFDETVDVDFGDGARGGGSASGPGPVANCVIALPVNVEGETLGVLVVARHAGEVAFKEEEQKLLQAVVGKAAFAITNALRDDSVLALRRLLKDTPTGASKAQSDLDGSLHALSMFARRAARAEDARVYMVDYGRNEVWTRTEEGVVRSEIGKGSVGWAAQTGASLSTSRTAAGSKLHECVDTVKGQLAITAAVMPIRDTGTGAVTCVMQALNKKHGEFTQLDLMLLHFCGKVSAVLVNSEANRIAADRAKGRLTLLTQACRDVFAYRNMADMLMAFAKIAGELLEGGATVYVLSGTDHRRWDVYTKSTVSSDQLRTGVASEVILKGELVSITKTGHVEARQRSRERSGAGKGYGGRVDAGSSPSASVPSSTPAADKAATSLWAAPGAQGEGDAAAANTFSSLCAPVFATSQAGTIDVATGVLGALEITTTVGSGRLFVADHLDLIAELSDLLSAAISFMGAQQSSKAALRSP